MKNRIKKPILKLVLHFLRKYPLRSWVVLGAMLLAGFVEIIGIGALLPILNVILGDNASNADPNILTQMLTALFDFLQIEQSFSNLLLVVVVTICLKSFIGYQAMKLVAFAAADITNDLRINLINSLMRAKWSYYSTLPVGKSANAIATEAESAGYFYTLAGKTVASLIQASIYTSIAFIVDWKISLTAIIIGIISAFLFKFLVQMARISGEKFTNSLNNLLTLLNESLSGAKTLKAMGAEENFVNLLKTDTKNINLARKKQAVSNLSLHAFQEPLLVTLIATGLFFAYTYTNYPVTELLLITFLFHRLVGYANLVQANYQKTVGFEHAVSSILNATESAQNNTERMSGKKNVQLKKQIQLDNITLAYDKHIVCQNLNSIIPANKITVVFGPSGIGKSTVLDAILGLISPTKGKILIDETDLSEIDLKKWRSLVGYVPQETFLFHNTIYANVTMGDNRISQEDTIDALKKAHAWEFISTLDDQLMHIVGERGGKLSGGQRQRIALARALVRKPSLLILDEATTGLDQETEDEILSTLQHMLSDMTIIAISHDPKILDIANHIIRLDKQS